MFRNATFLCLFGLVTALWSVSAIASAVQSDPSVEYKSTRKNVLVLVSSHKADSWSEAITKGVEEVFATSVDTYGIWTEYMDATRFTSSNARGVLASLYRHKYTGLKFDVIVTIGMPAVNFVRAYAGELYPGVPVVFSGLSAGQAKEAMRTVAIAGVSERFDYRKTLDAAFQLLPDTQKIIFISPDMKNRQAVDLLLPNYRPEINIEIWHTPELSQILKKVAKVRGGAIIVPLAEPGRLPQYTKSQNRFMDALTAVSQVPVFSVWDVALGHGILGGYLTPGKYQGNLAGSRALRMIQGKPPLDPALAKVSAARLTVDREALKRFAINTQRLPETTRFYPLEAKPWRWLREYYRQIAVVFFFLSAISAILLYLLISRHKAQMALGESESRFRAMFEHLPMSLTLRDLQGRLLLLNPAFEKRHNLEPGSASGKSADQIFDPHFAAVLREQDLDVISRNTAVEREHTLRDEQNDVDETLLIVKYPVRDSEGAIHAIGTCALDISERNRAMVALAESELRFQRLYDHAPDIYFSLKGNGQISAINKFGADCLGYDKDTLEGTSILDLIHRSERDRVRESLDALHRGVDFGTGPNNEFRLICNDASVIWVNMRVHIVPAVSGNASSLWAICRDVSTAHQLSEELSYQASHDSLTGLVNRREFEQRLERAVESIHTSKAQHALCFLDLDQFKIVNDSCGHLAGDELLCQLGQVFKQRLRHRDIVARVGGDEFAVLIEHCPLQQACKIAEQIRADVELHRFNWHGQAFPVGVSIGIAPITADSGTAEDILTAADSACYFAKEQGRNRIHVHTQDSLDVARHHGEVRWVMRLQNALDENRFELWSQRMGPVDEGFEPQRLANFEICLRLRNEDNILQLPEVFMPSAERFGLGVRIDRWQISHAFDWLSANPDWLDRFNCCFINLCAASITDGVFLEFVQTEFSRSQVPADRICFVITETVAISKFAQVINFMATLKPHGCRFAVGDFGSGWSSFTHLKRLDVDFLKIDGQLIGNIINDPVDLAMVQSILHVGNIMQNKTIAVGVDNEQLFETLANLGVHFGQGDFLEPVCLLDAMCIEDSDVGSKMAGKANIIEKGTRA